MADSQSKNQWTKLADPLIIQATIKNLKKNGIDAVLVNSKEDAKRIVLEHLPKGVQVMTMTSETLRLSSIADEINNSKNYDSVRASLAEEGISESQKRKLGAGPDYTVGSVHAVTQDGRLLIASATGSQLPAYAYGAKKVIWVVGVQKIVKNMDEAMKRLQEHTYPLEDARAKKAYGSGSFISKVLMINKEVQPGRMLIIFVNELIGF